MNRNHYIALRAASCAPIEHHEYGYISGCTVINESIVTELTDRGLIADDGEDYRITEDGYSALTGLPSFPRPSLRNSKQPGNVLEWLKLLADEGPLYCPPGQDYPWLRELEARGLIHDVEKTVRHYRKFEPGLYCAVYDLTRAGHDWLFGPCKDGVES